MSLGSEPTPAQRRGRVRFASVMIVILTILGGLSGPVGRAFAAFTSSPATSALTVATVTPTASSPAVAMCGVLAGVGIVDDRITVSWPAAGSPAVTGFGILVNGAQVATLPASATAWTDTNLLALGTVDYQVRVYYGAAQIWYADSPPQAVTYRVLSNMC